MSITDLTAEQKNLLRLGDNARGGLVAVLDSLLTGVNAAGLASDVANRTRVAVVAGTNGAIINNPSDVGTVLAVLAITTSTGAAAAKLLQAVTTDYTVAAGKVTCVGDKSALTLIIVYLTA